MYYLQSRYYDPQIARFINADATPQISFATSDAITVNMYPYCSNAPVHMCDTSGFFPITYSVMYTIVCAFSGAYIGAAVARYFNLKGWKKSLCMAGGTILMGVAGWFFPLTSLYAMIKDLLYAAGSGYLAYKGYYVALMAYSHGMWGAGKSLSSDQKQTFIDKIKKSEEYHKIKTKLKKRIRNGETTPRVVLEFTKDRDLYYAIQHITMTLVYVPNRRDYRVMLHDTYDFTQWRNIITKSSVSFANAANNLGVAMQKCGMMIPYEISLQFYDK